MDDSLSNFFEIGMNHSYKLPEPSSGKSSQTTTDFALHNGPVLTKTKSREHKQCNIAIPGATGRIYSHEIGCLLHHRLLIAASIFAVGFTLFFLRSVFEHSNFLGFSSIDRIIQGLAAAILVLIASLLLSKIRLSVTQLRIVELVLFGVVTAYFAWIQIILMSNGNLLEWANRSSPEAEGNFMRIANYGNVLRWFGLIVIYGTFVPNTWKRCALIVGILAAIPLSLTALTLNCPVMCPFAVQSLLDMVILLGIASTIAIFGSYKISSLQKEAIEAKKLGQYQLKTLLGKGGMGEVYLGEHLMLRRACAIKLIRPDHSHDSTTLSRFEREVKAMAALTHWNNVEVFDYGIADDGTFYYVMEYLPGLSMQELVDKYGPLSPERTVYFLRQLCDALQEAHSIGFIHRDIKPSNVIVCERGGMHDVAKLLDFGLVQSLGLGKSDARLTMQGVVLGSPPYMSPEQAMGKEELDGRSDIYSLGGLAYFLLTGQPAFQRDTPMQILMAHVYDPVPPIDSVRPDIPGDLEDVINKCLSKKPEDRYSTVEELEEALADCVCAHDCTRKDATNWWLERSGKSQMMVAAG